MGRVDRRKMCNKVGILVSYMTEKLLIWGHFEKNDRTLWEQKFTAASAAERPATSLGSTAGGAPRLGASGFVKNSLSFRAEQCVNRDVAWRSPAFEFHSLGSRFYLRGLAPCDRNRTVISNRWLIYRVRSPSALLLNLETFIQLNLSCESSRVLGQTV